MSKMVPVSLNDLVALFEEGAREMVKLKKHKNCEACGEDNEFIIDEAEILDEYVIMRKDQWEKVISFYKEHGKTNKAN